MGNRYNVRIVGLFAVRACKFYVVDSELLGFAGTRGAVR
jgi:hypothetical protein